jgi:hypothetical protein
MAKINNKLIINPRLRVMDHYPYEARILLRLGVSRCRARFSVRHRHLWLHWIMSYTHIIIGVDVSVSVSYPVSMSVLHKPQSLASKSNSTKDNFADSRGCSQYSSNVFCTSPSIYHSHVSIFIPSWIKEYALLICLQHDVERSSFWSYIPNSRRGIGQYFPLKKLEDTSWMRI